jgi:hypothetical protein
VNQPTYGPQYGPPQPPQGPPQGPYAGNVAPAPAPGKKPRHTVTLPLLVLVLIIVGTWLVSCVGGAMSAGGGTDAAGLPAATTTVTETVEPAEVTATETVTKAPEKSAEPKAEPQPKAPTTYGDGDYLVGSEIKPGTYKSNGHSDMLCYADTKTRKGKILEQEVAEPGDKVIIEIRSNAYRFSSKDCGKWRRVG